MNKINKPIIALAPMDGVTDYPYRAMVEKYSPIVNMFFTEFVPVQGFFSRPKLFIPKLLFKRSNNKNILQVFGKATQHEYFRKITHIAKYAGFDGIDLNTGCPDKGIMKSGGGSALIGDQQSVRKIITTIQSANKNPIQIDTKIINLIDYWRDEKGFFAPPNERISVSLKTRLGITKLMEDNWWKFLDSLKLNLITIHFRTQKQGYEGSPNWKQGTKLVKLMKTPIIGNGDITMHNEQCTMNNLQSLLNKKLEYTPYGIMIGRAFMGNPALLSNKQIIINKETQLKYLREHLEFEQQIREINPNTQKRLINMYIRNFEGSKELRDEMISDI